MTNREIAQAANALIAWFKSQDVGPKDATPILALAICIASISLGEDFDEDIDNVNHATKLVVDTFAEMLQNPEAFSPAITAIRKPKP